MTGTFFNGRGRIPGWVKKLLPVLVSLGILYYYFHNQDLEQVFSACRGANLLMAILATVVPQLVMWLMNAILTERNMVWFHGPFDLWKFFWVRGAIFILQMINNPLAQGGTMLYIQRKARVSWTKLLGIFAFRFQLMLWGLCVMMVPATLAMHWYGLDDMAKINMWIWWGFLIFEVQFLAGSWFFWHYNLDFTRLGGVIVRDRKSEFWQAFNMATPRQWLVTWALTVPQVVFSLVSYYFVALAFDVRVPFWECLVVMPLVLTISNLPIAFGGFGTTTLAWITLFGDYGSAENIAALTLFLPSARAVSRAIIGLVSLPPAVRDIGSLFQEPGAGTREVFNGTAEKECPVEKSADTEKG